MTVNRAIEGVDKEFARLKPYFMIRAEIRKKDRYRSYAVKKLAEGVL